MRIITLITDFGTRDSYVGALNGVVASIAPDARVVDISHEVEPHNVAHGAFLLWQAAPWYPPGTIHLAVVDPGVGTARRVVVGKYSGHYFVAPDNGLLTWIHKTLTFEALHVVEEPRYWLSRVSATFHGRDIMAPVAAHLSLGVELHRFGRATDGIELLPTPLRAEVVGDRLRGQIIYVDRFGNLVTNVHREQVLGTSGHLRPCRVLAEGVDLGPLRTTFADVPSGAAVAYLGSAGFVEIAVNRGRAADQFRGSAAFVVDVFLT